MKPKFQGDFLTNKNNMLQLYLQELDTNAKYEINYMYVHCAVSTILLLDTDTYVKITN